MSDTTTPDRVGRPQLVAGMVTAGVLATVAALGVVEGVADTALRSDHPRWPVVLALGCLLVMAIALLVACRLEHALCRHTAIAHAFRARERSARLGLASC